MIDALSIDFDFLALKSYFALIAHRPSSSIAFAHALINEETVEQILGILMLNLIVIVTAHTG